MSTSSSYRDRVAGGRLRRSASVAGLATRATGRAALGSLRGRSGREQAALRTAEDIARTMGDMKGVAMKLGQILSLMSGTVPPEFAERLSELQSDAPPVHPDLVRQVFREDLASEPEDLFAEFEWEPLAAASIGQVHRARLRSGEDVAVKVQYPGVREAVTADLANLGLLFGMTGVVARGLDPGPIVRDLREGIAGELDYRRELANQQAFADLFRGHPAVVIPRPYPDLSTDRVLVQEFVEGRRLATARSLPDDARNAIAEVLFRFTFGSMHRAGMFQADPHAGNFLLLDDDRVAFLDFGCVTTFEPALRATINRMIAGVVSGDLGAWREGMEAVGYVPADLDISTDDLWRHMELYYRFILEDGVTFTPELAAAMVRQNVQLTGEAGSLNRRLNIPAGMVFTQRINFGFAGLMAGLRASGPWRSIIAEYVLGAPPSTPLGERAAAIDPTGWI